MCAISLKSSFKCLTLNPYTKFQDSSLKDVRVVNTTVSNGKMEG